MLYQICNTKIISFKNLYIKVMVRVFILDEIQKKLRINYPLIWTENIQQSNISET